MISNDANYLIYSEERMGRRVYRISIPSLIKTEMSPMMEWENLNAKHHQA